MGEFANMSNMVHFDMFRVLAYTADSAKFGSGFHLYRGTYQINFGVFSTLKRIPFLVPVRVGREADLAVLFASFSWNHDRQGFPKALEDFADRYPVFVC